MNKKSKKLNKTYYFFYPGNINTKTGGYIYEKNILQRAKTLNFNLKAIQLRDFIEKIDEIIKKDNINGLIINLGK